MTTFVSFFDSGSLGRAHYTLVRNIETHSSPDQFILDELGATKSRIQRASLKEIKECLVILLHCSMSSINSLPPESFAFAIPHAVNLIELGKTIQDKRIGYLYCSEFLTPNHELALMLVNTLRKDLESSDVACICLAIDYIIQSPDGDVIPAIDTRLFDLLSHNSPAVRRRALLAFRALCGINPELFLRTESKILKRLGDSDQGVVNAALLASSFLVKIDGSTRARHQPKVEELLQIAWEDKSPEAILSSLRALTMTGCTPHLVPLLSRILRFGLKKSLYSTVREVFLVLETLDRQVLWDNITSGVLTAVQDIRGLLYSHHWNNRYLFLVCLESVDPILWAGTSDEIPAAMEEQDVQHILMLLNSHDHLMRVKTLRVLNKIDSGLISAYHAQALQNIPPAMTSKAQNEFLNRLLEVLATLFSDDGEAYAHNLFDTVRLIEQSTTEQHILEEGIQTILPYIRHGLGPFRIGAVTHLATRLTNDDMPLGPTLMVIVAALLTECFEQIAIPPRELLLGMSHNLSTYPVPVQDACILAMIRIAANCEKVPQEVNDTIANISSPGGRYIRQRCEQFNNLIADQARLRLIINRAKSSSLPDFLASLLLVGSTSTPSHSPHLHTTTLLSPNPPTKVPKLRYEVYANPVVSPTSLSRRRLSSGSSNLSLPSYSGRSGHSASSIHDALSQTVTPGDLALAAGTEEFELMSQRAIRAKQFVEETGKVDLIAFDSPFLADPSTEPSPPGPGDPSKEPSGPADFEAEWNELDDSSHAARGWCEASSDDIQKRLEALNDLSLTTISAEELPYRGEVKILVNKEVDGTETALLRIRDTEDGSLWRMRSASVDLRLLVKRQLVEEG